MPCRCKHDLQQFYIQIQSEQSGIRWRGTASKGKIFKELEQKSNK